MPSSDSSSAPEPAAAVAAQRLFLAIKVPASIAAVLAGSSKPVGGIAWAKPDRLHLTLRFLGDTPPPVLGPLREQLRTIRVACFRIPVAGLGVFPPQGPPRVLWCGVGPGHPVLCQLRQRIDDALLALGLEADRRTFVPHFTLARLDAVNPERLAGWLHRHRAFAAAPFLVDRFALYASELRPTGAVHTALEEYPLIG